MLRIIDISFHQKGIDYSKLDIDGAIVKSTERDVDVRYHEHVDGLRQYGKRVGHYQFNNHEKSVKANANFFVDNLYRYETGDPLVIDVEFSNSYNTPAYTPAETLEWLQTVKSRIPDANLYVYMSQSVTKQDWSQVAPLARLWVAHYDIAPGSVKVYNWADWTGHQFTSSASVGGYNSRVDDNVFKDDAWDLVASIPGNVPGAEDRSVAEYQALLNAKGWNLDIDNVHGPVTNEAVKEFQLLNGLEVDGVVGSVTLSALKDPKSKGKSSTGVITPPANPNLTPSGRKKIAEDGAEGPETILSLQQVLNRGGRA